MTADENCHDTVVGKGLTGPKNKYKDEDLACLIQVFAATVELQWLEQTWTINNSSSQGQGGTCWDHDDRSSQSR